MGFLIFAGERVEIPGVDVRNFVDEPALALRMPQDGYVRHNEPDVIVNHKINGDKPEHVVPGAMPPGENLGWRNVHCWQNDGRAGATQLVNDGTLIQTADIVTCAAYGAGWANGHATQIEHCEHRDGTTWERVIETGALANDLIAEKLGIVKQFVLRSPGDHRPGLREAWPFFQGATSHYTIDYDHRGYWDCGRAVFDLLASKYGWRELALADVINGAPPVVLPSWLDPSTEIHPGAYAGSHGEFAAMAVDAALAWRGPFGITVEQACGIAGNAIEETGWGRVYAGHNLGGWKIHEADVTAWKGTHGVCPPWWKREGHRASGDPPWCFYRVFSSDAAFMKEWVTEFVPRPDWPDPRGRYRATGRAFWSGGDWQHELVDAGYKGTPPDPARTVATLHALAETAKVMWAQSKLHVAPDGKAGAYTKAATIAFQRQRGLPETGTLDAATLEAMAG